MISIHALFIWLLISEIEPINSYSYKYDQIYLRHNLLKRQKQIELDQNIEEKYRIRKSTYEFQGNQCLEKTPWPCKTSGYCLSLDFVCDGDFDCPDGYDEDVKMCIAKSRPPYEILKRFIEKYQDWLVPAYLGEADPGYIATQLIESPTINEYSKMMNLNKEQILNLISLMEAVREDREIELIIFGMPPRAWNELSILFGRITKSGFVQ